MTDKGKGEKLKGKGERKVNFLNHRAGGGAPTIEEVSSFKFQVSSFKKKSKSKAGFRYAPE